MKIPAGIMATFVLESVQTQPGSLWPKSIPVESLAHKITSVLHKNGKHRKWMWFHLGFRQIMSLHRILPSICINRKHFKYCGEK